MVSGTDHKYGYNGKEEQGELNLNWLNLGARNHDPALGRFMNIDPRTEDYYFQSTYAFAVNNPIFFVDINGEGVNDDYKLLDGGKLKPIAKNNNPDRIFATDSEGNVIEDKSITLEKDGQIANMDKPDNVEGQDSEPIDVGVIEFESSDVANEVFEFVSENSGVEWYIVTSEGSKSYVGTSYSEGTNRSGSYSVIKLARQRFNNILKTHSHPRSSTTLLKAIIGISKFRQTPSQRDTDNAGVLNSKHPNTNITYKAYDPINQTYYNYSSRDYIQPVPSIKSKPIKM